MITNIVISKFYNAKNINTIMEAIGIFWRVPYKLGLFKIGKLQVLFLFKQLPVTSFLCRNAVVKLLEDFQPGHFFQLL